MTREEITSFGYTHFESPVKGTIFIKQNGTVVFVERDNELILPNGNKISNPTKKDFEKPYSESVAFPKLQGCRSCTKK